MIARGTRTIVVVLAFALEAHAQPPPPAAATDPAPPAAPAPRAAPAPPAVPAPPAPTVLGSPRPAPVEPPPAPDPPGFHVGVVTPQESTVFGRRLRSGGGRRGLGDRARERPGTDGGVGE